MLRHMGKSKIHNARVTEANLNYTGSITIDANLMQSADILPGERVQIVNINNGQRVETYCIKGAPGSGTICMNGAAARWAEVDDRVIIISYCLMEDSAARKYKMRRIQVDENNQVKEFVEVKTQS
jgi:aspartate 1-decarboxylase